MKAAAIALCARAVAVLVFVLAVILNVAAS